MIGKTLNMPIGTVAAVT